MNEQHDERAEEQRIEALLQNVGPRMAPPAELARKVREAVKHEWQRTLAERGRARRVRLLQAAASFAAITVIAAAWAIMNSSPAAQIARAAQIEGEVTGDAGLLHAARPLSIDAMVYVGDEVSTGPNAYATFHIDDGLSLQLDENSAVRLVDHDRLALERGAVYVASEPAAARSAAFMIATRNGTIRHIGTQYEVRTMPSGVQVSVREGRVIVDTDGVLHEGKAGERIAIGNDGGVSLTLVAREGPHWRWVDRGAPSFDIENQSLDDFLSWFARETGTRVSFASPDVARAAHDTILRGSIEGLEPHAALAAVLATTELSSAQGRDGSIVIQRRE